MDHEHQGVQHLRHRHTQVRGSAFDSYLWDFPYQNTSGTRWLTPWQLLQSPHEQTLGCLSAESTNTLSCAALMCAFLSSSVTCASRSFNLLNQRQDVQFLLLSNVNATAGFVNANVIVRSSLSVGMNTGGKCCAFYQGRASLGHRFCQLRPATQGMHNLF